MKRAAIFCLILCIMLLAGCNSAEKEFIETEKWKSYVAAVNYFDVMEKTVNGYIETFGEQSEYIPPANIAHFSLPEDSDDIAKAIDKALENGAKGKQNDLDKNARETLTPIKDLWQNIIAADSYYKNKEYEKDDFNKAKEYHVKILTDLKVVKEKAPAFNTAIENQELKLRSEELAKLRKDGFKLRASIIDAMDAAQYMQAALAKDGITSMNVEKMDVTAFKVSYDRFSKIFGEYQKLSEAEDLLKKEKLKKSSIEKLSSAFADVNDAAQEIINNSELQKTENQPLKPMTKGTPEYLYQKMKALVFAYRQAVTL